MTQLIMDGKTGLITLPDLKQSIDETTLGKKPLNGIRHADLFDRILSIAEDAKFQPIINEIYVSDTGISNMPGVSVLPLYEAQYEEKDIRAYIIRRLLGRITFEEHSDENTNTVIAISYHQQGFQVAYGTNVRICSNLCIFGGKLLSSYGDNRFGDHTKMFNVISDYFKSFKAIREAEKAILEVMSNTHVDFEKNIIPIIGKLEAHAVNKAYIERGISPFNIGQVSAFTKKVLIAHNEYKMDNLYDLYNAGTSLHQPGSNDFVSLLSANNSFSNFIIREFEPEFADVIKEHGNLIGMN